MFISVQSHQTTRRQRAVVNLHRKSKSVLCSSGTGLICVERKDTLYRLQGHLNESYLFFVLRCPRNLSAVCHCLLRVIPAESREYNYRLVLKGQALLSVKKIYCRNHTAVVFELMPFVRCVT